MKHWIKRAVVVLALLCTVGGAAAWYSRQENAQTPSFRTVRVTRSDLVVSIGATGTVEPEEVIDVGAQVAGRIVSFGKDVTGKGIDYRSDVEEGTLLARIDDSLYAAQAAEAEAQAQQAKAAVVLAQANLTQAKAKLYQAQRDWERAQKLGPSEALAQSSYDAYQSGYEIARANVAVSEASIVQAQASQTQTEAVLQENRQRLSYCTITSPVKGVIIDRRVNIGQTVVASLNAPSLFLLAKDLTRMQVWVAVNEADIGKIHVGQPVTFTVGAFPGEAFRGQVGKVRLNASMTQNVVTYTVEVNTDNSSGRLLPYLTADVQFELQRREGVLLVPIAALRWTPTAEEVAPAFREAFSAGSAGQGTESGRLPPAAGAAPAADHASAQGVLWVVEGRHVQPITVRVGLANRANETEVEGKDLTEGLEVVTGSQVQAAAPTDDRNPFAPRIPQRGGRGAGGTGGPNRP